jgi:ABC-type nitrate/sulfonate/bicarbonate transport system ATPase subunit
VGVLRIEAVSRVFPGVRGGVPTRALERTDLEVQDNDFICILGPSGCGKSTLLRIVAGLDRPTTGRVLLDGQAAERPGPDRGMVFQSYTLFPWLTVKENILFGSRSNQGKAVSLIEKTGLRGFENHYPKMLSGGHAAAHRARPRARQRPEDPAARRALRRARQPDARADAGAAPRDLGGRPQDRALSSPTTSTRRSSWRTASP